MWEVVASIGGSLLGGLLGSKGSKKAARALQEAANQANAKQTEMYNTGIGYYQPYANLGGIAAGQLENLLRGDYTGFYNSPDYKAALDTGLKALDRSAAARGGLYSGGHSADLENFGQQLAAQYLSNYRNAITNAAQGFGMGSANAMAGFGQNYANAYGQNLLTGAGAKSSGIINSTNSWMNALGGVAKGVGNLLGGL